MNFCSKRLIVFTRYPEPGKTKTRMIPALGAEGAAGLQRQMTEKTIKVAQQLQFFSPVDLAIYFNGGSQELMQAWLGNLNFYAQSRGDLGEKLRSALEDSFSQGFNRIVVIGIDCPDLTASILAQAFQSLETADLVIGPAVDGGYYLIGLKFLIPEVFQNIDWGTSLVLDQTKTQAEMLSLSIKYLPTLQDIDRPEDLL